MRTALRVLAKVAVALALTVLSIVAAKLTNDGLAAVRDAEPQHHVITFDGGGNPFEFMERFTEQRHRGDTFEIDGLCFSACTLILAEVPPDHLCATPYARLGFHAAFHYDVNGQREFSEEATRIIWSAYPESVRVLLQKHGWSGPNVDQPQPIILEGAELFSLVKPCAAS